LRGGRNAAGSRWAVVLNIDESKGSLTSKALRESAGRPCGEEYRHMSTETKCKKGDGGKGIWMECLRSRYRNYKRRRKKTGKHEREAITERGKKEEHAEYGRLQAKKWSYIGTKIMRWGAKRKAEGVGVKKSKRICDLEGVRRGRQKVSRRWVDIVRKKREIWGQRDKLTSVIGEER